MSNVSRYVVVATKTRPWSIIAGELVEQGEDWVELRNARMIAYFTADSRTVAGIASRGVTSGARVSPRVDSGRFYGIEMVLDASDDARKSVEAEPWS